MVHGMEPEDRPIEELRRRHLGGQWADVFVTGDTHIERLDYRDGVLQINSGAQLSLTIGRRASAPWVCSRSDATSWRLASYVSATRRGRRNPGIEYSFSRDTGVVRLG